MHWPQGRCQEMCEENRKKTFLGFDFSTQRLKAIVIGEDYGVLHEADVEFDVDLPEFRTSGGVIRGEGRGEVMAPPLLWVKALDMVMDKLTVAGVDFSTIVALSGAGQQHGSVWWSRGSEERLSKLSPDEFLHSQLATSFVCDSPVWMDSSTTAHCKALEDAVGGPEELAKVTGSRAYERFTGCQIRKMYQSRPRVYQATERISLVSSFACSLLLGSIAPIDLADGSGMNLLDVHEKTWWEPALQACGDESLATKLGAPVPSPTVLGAISPYFVSRYGFDKSCRVVAFTGDNCSAVAGLRLKSGWVGLSLGTSDTLLLGLAEAAAPPAGHILVGPTPDVPYMALLCFSNGSLTRQSHRDRLAGHSWDAFNDLLRATVRGNLGYMASTTHSSSPVIVSSSLHRVGSTDHRPTEVQFTGGAVIGEPDTAAQLNWRIQQGYVAQFTGGAMIGEPDTAAPVDSSPEDTIGIFGIYYDTAEIVPRAPSIRRLYDGSGRLIEKAAPQFEARALLETQAVARRAHAEDMGFQLGKSSRLIATGGASVNRQLLQIFADVFNSPVYVQNEHANAALLGAAFRAAEVWSAQTGTSLSGSEPTVSPVATPFPDAATIYTPMLQRYRTLLADLPKLG